MTTETRFELGSDGAIVGAQAEANAELAAELELAIQQLAADYRVTTTPTRSSSAPAKRWYIT